MRLKLDFQMFEMVLKPAKTWVVLRVKAQWMGRLPAPERVRSPYVAPPRSKFRSRRNPIGKLRSPVISEVWPIHEIFQKKIRTMHENEKNWIEQSQKWQFCSTKSQWHDSPGASATFGSIAREATKREISVFNAGGVRSCHISTIFFCNLVQLVDHLWTIIDNHC